MTQYYSDAARDQLLERPAPNSSEAERAILGAIILDNELIWQAREYGITGEWFYVPSHRRIWDAMNELAEQGSEINQILIAEVLRRDGQVEAVGGVTYITNLMMGLPHFANIAHFAKIVHDKFYLRQLVKGCNAIVSKALEEEEGMAEIMGHAESAVLELASNALRGHKKARSIDYVPLAKDRIEFIHTLEERAAGRSDALPTGIKPIDDKLEGGGLNPQGLYLVAAKPKAGKTSLVLGWAERIARRFAEEVAQGGEKKSVAVASLEMRRLALQMRAFSAYTGIPFDTLMRPGKLRGVEKDLAFASLEGFFGLPLYINDAVFSIPEYKRASERVVFGEMQARLLIADYLQLFSRDKDKTPNPDNLTGEVTIISRELKHTAQVLNVPLVGISSLNEAGQLRQSRTLEYDVEALFILENLEWTPNMTPEQRAILDAKPVWDINARLAYQRNGPTGDIPLKFLRRNMQFVTPQEFAQMEGRGSVVSKDLNTLWEQTGG
jgi:replicative DNA helicase